VLPISPSCARCSCRTYLSIVSSSSISSIVTMHFLFVVYQDFCVEGALQRISGLGALEFGALAGGVAGLFNLFLPIFAFVSILGNGVCDVFGVEEAVPNLSA
jgi:hypothetical protein